MKIQKMVLIDYMLLLLTIAVSEVPYFSASTLYAPLFVILSVVFLLRKKKLNLRFVIFIVVLLLLLTFLQSCAFDFYSLQTTIFIGFGAAWLLQELNKYIVLKYFDISVVGVYTFAYLIDRTLQILNQTVLKTIRPIYYQKLHEGGG